MIFIIDTNVESLAVREASKLNIPIVAIIDTNSDPNLIDYEIPSNDDSFTSVSIIMEYISSAISDGLEEREKIKEEMRIKQEKEASAREAAAKEAAVKEAKEAKKEKSKR